MFLATWLTMALAAPCPDLQAEVDAGWNAYEDAELIQAEGHVARAIRSLSCMEASAGKDALLQLYRLNALLSITQSDREGAVYATIRVVTIDPAAEPDPRLGPELADMHETWSARLAQSIIRVAYEGTGGAWIDGQPVGEPWIEVYSGEHVVQFDGPDGWVSRVEELDSSVTLGPPGAKPPPDPEPPRDPNSQFKARRVALLTGGGAVFAAGGGLLGIGAALEGRFAEEAYASSSYGDCSLGDLCYEAARELAIRRDAARVRAMYISAYAALGVGAGIIGTELFLLPSADLSGGTLHLSGRF